MASSNDSPGRAKGSTSANVGAYEQPFTGIGEEFEPLGAAPASTALVLHESGYETNNSAWNFPRVYSPFWRITYDYQPGHLVRFGDEETNLGPDHVYVIPNHQRFDCIGNRPVTKLWFCLSPSRHADPRQPMPVGIPVNETIAAFVQEMPKLFETQGSDRRQQIYWRSLSFILYILSRPEIHWQQDIPPQLTRIVTLINKDPAHQWTNSLMARSAGLSTDGFIRAFRKWMNTTPNQYIRQVRVREACHLLSSTGDSIDTIANQLGFPDRFYFTRVFKRHTNTTPAQYRRLSHE